MLNEAEGATPLEQAVFCLQDKLQEASLLEGRSGAIEALLAVSEFLSAISGREELLHQRPLNELVSALSSLNDGKVLPLLEPVRRSGRPRNSVAKEGAKAIAAYVVKRLCETGLDANEAYERVALVCRKAGVRPGRKGSGNQKGEMTARTVREWCEAISADVGCYSRAGRHFRLLMSVMPFLHGTTTPDAILARLRRFLADTSTA
jgi:hypothetical protein